MMPIRPAMLVLVLLSMLAFPVAAPAAREDTVDSSVHYDQVFRWRAMAAHAEGDYAGAIRDFERAAKFADKPAQFALGAMHLNGEGVPRDRALAWAWYDVAAERGYEEIVEQRRLLWDVLTDHERVAASYLSQRLLATYGDAKAKPRHRSRTLAALQHSLGKSKSVRDDVIVTDMQNCSAGRIEIGRGNPCHVADFFADRFDPERYWRVQDAAWGRGGIVEVGPVLKRPGH